MALSVSSIPILFYLAAVVLFFLASQTGAKGWYTPIGLACFTLGHIVTTIGLKAT